MNDSIFELIRRAWALACGMLTTTMLYFMPIRDLVEVLVGVFLVSFTLGVYHSVAIQGEVLNKTKGLKAFKEAVLYVMCLASMFVIGEKMHTQGALLSVLSTITWSLIYLYATNIFKNLNRIFPEYKGIRLIYYIVSLEFLRRFPSLNEFENKEKKNDENKD